MELLVVPKGSKYVVEDKKSRLLYSVKKKGFGGKFNLFDASNYLLYSLVQTGDERKPSFTVVLNDATFLTLTCKSLFLDPTIEAEGNGMQFSLVSKDRKNFTIFKNGANVGSIRTLLTINNELHYEIQIDNTAFDDYIPFFAVAIDRAFGDMNKNK